MVKKHAAIINEMVESVHAAGGLCGVHCCGNTEWPILMDAGVDIVNFDAYEFGETIAMYPEQVKKHLENGGYLAWGVVPTSEKIFDNDVASLVAVYDKNVERLSALGIDINLIHDKTIITPSCGTGSLSLEAAIKVFELLGGTAKSLKERG